MHPATAISAAYRLQVERHLPGKRVRHPPTQPGADGALLVAIADRRPVAIASSRRVAQGGCRPIHVLAVQSDTLGAKSTRFCCPTQPEYGTTRSFGTSSATGSPTVSRTENHAAAAGGTEMRKPRSVSARVWIPLKAWRADLLHQSRQLRNLDGRTHAADTRCRTVPLIVRCGVRDASVWPLLYWSHGQVWR